MNDCPLPVHPLSASAVFGGSTAASPLLASAFRTTSGKKIYHFLRHAALDNLIILVQYRRLAL